MKKIGTLSSAVGFIFLGVWMIINKSDPKLGNELFKWWPLIIILLGVEILIHFGTAKGDDQKAQINYIIIPVIIIFSAVNIFQSVLYNLGRGIGISKEDLNLLKIIEFVKRNNNENYKSIQGAKNLPLYGNKIYILADNLKVTLKSGNSISITSRVYVDKFDTRDKYELIEKKESDGYSISIKDSFIKKVELEITLPENFDVDISGDNVDMNGEELIKLNNLSVNGNNLNINVCNSSNLIADGDNSNIKALNINNIKIKSNNANADIKGDSSFIEFDCDNGKIDIENNICKDIKINMNTGVVNINTKDKNVDVNLLVNQGTTKLNNENRVNSGISKILGTGISRVFVKLDTGNVKFSSLEW